MALYTAWKKAAASSDRAILCEICEQAGRKVTYLQRVACRDELILTSAASHCLSWFLGEFGNVKSIERVCS